MSLNQYIHKGANLHVSGTQPMSVMKRTIMRMSEASTVGKIGTTIMEKKGKENQLINFAARVMWSPSSKLNNIFYFL
jgi:hypothetical protein